MKLLPHLLLTAALASPLAAQQSWVKNGDFSQGMTSWTGSGGGDQPKVESFDVNGLGSNPGFGVNAGPPSNSSLKPPYILSQEVIVSTGTYELYIDLAREAPSFNNDAGNVRVRLAGKDVTMHVWGRVTRTGTARDILCTQFRPSTGGKVKLEILFERTFASLRGRTPRLWIDNVGLWRTNAPTFCFRGERKPGNQVTLELTGSASSPFVVFVAARAIPGFPVPGFFGTWRLDLATTIPVLSGVLGTNGSFRQNLTLTDTLGGLQGIPLYYQPVGLPSVGRALGIHHNYGLQR